MFSSLAHQLKPQRPRISVEELREIAADHLLKNRDQFAAFLESDIGIASDYLIEKASKANAHQSSFRFHQKIFFA